jgi:diacylglycerol O-acyltransferase / trehalose O-mycolyltransferase / mycolyltransferase Ag85
MTRELPPLINRQYKANGRNAVGGLSSTGGTAVDYAIQAPGHARHLQQHLGGGRGWTQAFFASA